MRRRPASRCRDRWPKPGAGGRVGGDHPCTVRVLVERRGSVRAWTSATRSDGVHRTWVRSHTVRPGGEQPTDGGDQTPLPRPLARALDHRDRAWKTKLLSRPPANGIPPVMVAVASDSSRVRPAAPGRRPGNTVELDVFDCGERLTHAPRPLDRYTHRRPSMQIGPTAERQRLRRPSATNG